ncbi:MAG: DegT/DnrJ/EryC1/StrS family aminotransferase [Solirubrobacteraceae bacterium]
METLHNEPRTGAVPFVDLARQHAPLAAKLHGVFDRLLGGSAFILGEEVERFEAEFADYCGARQCVGVASGTAALTIMLIASGIGQGDQVIVPAHTFVASALAVRHAGATPVCVDVDRGSGLIDPQAARAVIGPSTAAILAVHLYGQACAMDELRALADRHGLALFEDAAQAHGATYKGVRVGGLGRAAAFSFYPSKPLGALGDGGAICTDDGDIARRARELRDLGRGADRVHVVAGYNERLDGLQAALLRLKLADLDRWNAARRGLAEAYHARLDGVVELLEESAESPCVYHLLPVRVNERQALAAALAARGIATGVHYPLALVDQPLWRGDDGASDVPNARDWAARELSLPMFPHMTAGEMDAVTTAVHRWARRVNRQREGRTRGRLLSRAKRGGQLTHAHAPEHGATDGTAAA